MARERLAARVRILAVGMALLCATACPAQTTLQWQGYTWNLKSGTGEGPGPNSWSPSNVFVDSSGNLHLEITNTNGVWSCAELWTTQSLPFGTYQCQVIGQIDTLDPNVVFGIFPYAGPDGTKEIDTEFSKWGVSGNNNGWWTVWPNDTNGQKADTSFNFSLNGTYTTQRFTWTSSGVQYWMLDGHYPVNSLTNLAEQWNYQPANPLNDIPQTPMPFHINLWLYQGQPATNGQPVEVVLNSFQFFPELLRFYDSPTSAAGGHTTFGVVQTAAASATASQVALSSNVSAALPPDTVTLPAGKTGVSFPITTSPVSTPTIATLTATLGSASLTTTVTVEPATIKDFYVLPATVTGGEGTRGVVQLESKAGPSGDTVSLSSGDPHVSVPSTVTVPAGLTGVSFPISTSAVSATTQVTLDASFYGSTARTTIELNP